MWFLPLTWTLGEVARETECLSNFKGFHPLHLQGENGSGRIFFLVLSSPRNIIPYWPLGLEMLLDLIRMRGIRLNWWILQIHIELLVLRKHV